MWKTVASRKRLLIKSGKLNHFEKVTDKISKTEAS